MTRSTPLLKFDWANLILPLPRGQQRGLVDKVGQVGSNESRGHRRDVPEIGFVVQGNQTRVDSQDALASSDIRAVNHDLSIEPAGTDECRVQSFGAIRGGDHDNAEVRVKAVHLHE